jgi:hypothetical protein
MNRDGSGLRELTDGTAADFNPVWTRNGTDRILFNRVITEGDQIRSEVRWTPPDAAKGEDMLLSDPARAHFGYSILKDGRILLREQATLTYYLMTPNPGGTPTYEQLATDAPV